MKLKMYWTEKKPEPPNKPPSYYYWYYEYGTNEPTVMEIWPNRWLEHLDGLWWPERIKAPTVKELIDEQKKDRQKNKKPQKQRRK